MTDIGSADSGGQDGPTRGAASAGSAGQASPGGGNPADQITQSMKAVTEALKAAGERVATNSQEVGLCAIRQAEENSRQLFDALRSMAATKSPREVTELYTRFVSESAKNQAQQLREMGELLAKTGRDAWAPITDALARAPAPR